MALITVSGLKKRFNLEAGFFARFGRFVQAVNGLDFCIHKNESYGLVGESGCGKTTTARLLVRMYEADEGSIFLQSAGQEPIDVRSLKQGELKQYREKVKYVFQDPARSLNPRMTIFEVLNSGKRWSSLHSEEKKSQEEAAAILEEVGLNSADLWRRPSEFSGGQRQRISIARALLMKPELLICDEVVSALDVSIQGQILNLLLDIRSRRDLSFLFIAHDLKVACYFCDRIGVMYRGELMEEASAQSLWKNGVHPYTELLFSSVAKPGGTETPAKAENPKKENPEHNQSAAEAAGSTESGVSPNRCAFADRCPYAEEKCFREKPLLRDAAAGHKVRCFRK